MRTTKVLSVSLPEEMLMRAENLAHAENRTMSELFREAFRAYELVRIPAGKLPKPKSLLRSKGLTERVR